MFRRALADHPLATTSVLPQYPPLACLNCGNAVPDRFCGRCGQDAHHTHRFTLRELLHHLPHSVWHVDKGLLFTLKRLMLTPGPTIRGYLAGQRVNHFHPLSLLLLVTGLYAFAFSQLHMTIELPHDPSVPEALRRGQEDSMAFFFKYLRWVYVAMVPFVAAFARWFLRRGKFNYAECLHLVAFVTAVGNFLALLYLPFTYAYGTSGLGQGVNNLLLVGVMVYSSWAYGSMLAPTGLRWPGRLLRGFLTQACGLLTALLVAMVILLAYQGSTVYQHAKDQHPHNTRK